MSETKLNRRHHYVSATGTAGGIFHCNPGNEISLLLLLQLKSELNNDIIYKDICNYGYSGLNGPPFGADDKVSGGCTGDNIDRKADRVKDENQKEFLPVYDFLHHGFRSAAFISGWGVCREI